MAEEAKDKDDRHKDDKVKDDKVKKDIVKKDKVVKGEGDAPAEGESTDLSAEAARGLPFTG
jgi:hypothetical protein